MEQIAGFFEEWKFKFRLTNLSYWLLLTITVTVAKDEHTFHRLTIVKAPLQTMMRDKRFEPLLLLSCKKDFTNSTDIVVRTKDLETLK